MERCHGVPPMRIRPIVEIALSNFLACSAYALSYAYVGPKSSSPDARGLLVENTSVKGDVYGEPGKTREAVTKRRRRNFATQTKCSHYGRSRGTWHSDRRLNGCGDRKIDYCWRRRGRAQDSGWRLRPSSVAGRSGHARSPKFAVNSGISTARGIAALR